MVSIGSLHMKFHAGFEILEKSPYRSEQQLIPSNLDTPSLTGRCICLRMSSDLIFGLQVAEIWSYPPPEFGYWESYHLGEIGQNVQNRASEPLLSPLPPPMLGFPATFLRLPIGPGRPHIPLSEGRVHISPFGAQKVDQ